MLHGVLGLLRGGEHVAAESQDRAVMAVEDGLEGRLRAVAHVLDETLVGGQPQQPRGNPRAGV